ncbi:MAG TPA: endonuclease/exonuclease/phosphatase family protein [Ktedonobacteraceae bacterium]|nr:endonuclease/exonuclease/phosphatase family protein [Ktedonobacteraceae bacterium]
MTRILSYNILAGGKRRVDQLTNIIRSTHPDIVGLIEAYNPQTVEEIANRLGMHYQMSGSYSHNGDWQIALLSRLPIIDIYVHTHPDILTKPIFEACIEDEDGGKLTVFIAHLSAAFYQSGGGDGQRRREIQEILRIMASKKGTPHLLMGDFNAIAPGDRLKASALLRYLIIMDQQYRRYPHVDLGHPNLDSVVPKPLRFLYPLMQTITRSKFLCALLDTIGSLYARRGSIGMLHRAGYIDCFRLKNPEDPGFTCPAASLAGRIDYIFASPELAVRLAASYVVTEGNGLRGDEASDHLPVVAEFGEKVETVNGPAYGLTIHRTVDLIDNA